MAKGKGQIGLTVAERSRPSSASFTYRGNAYEQWIQDLPQGNVGAMAKQLYSSLREVNRLIIGWRDRYHFLEQLRQPIEYVQIALNKRYADVSFPLSAKTRQIAELSKALAGEMALGYKTAIEEMLGSSFLNRDNKALTILIHRAVHYISCSLLTSYKTYAPHPEQSWFELHLLYLHAEHKNIHTKRIDDAQNKNLPHSSIARLYKQALLLALASPYRMRQGEAHAVHTALARWAGHAHIIPYNDPSAAEALFVVHMDSDDAPDYQSFNSRDCSTELCRLVDTRQLSYVLQEEIGHMRKGGKTEEGISPELLIRLIRSWGVAPKRNFNRSEKDEQLEVVIGIGNLHRALADTMGVEEQLSNKAEYRSHAVTGVSQPTSRDIWNIFSKETLGQQYHNYMVEIESAEKEEKHKRPEVVRHNWHIRNESAGGYRLSIDNNDEAKVQVGKLLGLRHPNTKETCEAGVIRWMRQPADGSFEVGVQVIAPEVVPVMLRNRAGSGKAAQFQPALLLPEVPAIALPATLITSTLLFETGMELQLQHPDKDVRVILTEQRQNTGSFSQFRFEVQSEEPQATPLREKLSPPSEEEKDDSGLSIDWDDI